MILTHLNHKVIRILILLLGFLTSCSGKLEKSNQTLNLAFPFTEEALDPRRSFKTTDQNITRLLFEGLLQKDAQGKIVEGIAERVEISKDRKNYTFYLRSCKWTDGREVTAYDFEKTWKDGLTPSFSSSLKPHFYPIKNARAAALGKAPLHSVGIYAVDAKILSIELEHPHPFFLDLLTAPPFFPLPTGEHVLESTHGGFHTTIVSNGPFWLKTKESPLGWQLEKNPTYWQHQDIKLNTVFIQPVENHEEMFASFEEGKIDWCGQPLWMLTREEENQLKKEKKLCYSPLQAVMWIFLDTQQPPFNNQKIRKAFGWAVDRNRLIADVLDGEGSPAMGLSRNLSRCESFFPNFDQKHALELFNEGLKEIKSTPDELEQIHFSSLSHPLMKRIQEELEHQWEEVFPIHTAKEQEEAHFSSLQGALWRSRWNDPIEPLLIFLNEKDPRNLSHWEDPRFRELVLEAEIETNPVRRKALLQKAEAFLLSEMPVIPLYFPWMSYAKSDKLENVVLSETGEIDFRKAFFKE